MCSASSSRPPHGADLSAPSRSLDGPGPEACPVALTIAGSDSGGGAGIQADLRAFTFLGVFGTTALTAVTAQNPKGVTDVCPVPSASVVSQIDAVFAEFDVRAVKTGMLFSADIIGAVADRLRAHRGRWLVVDPVMVATSGAKLLQDDAIAALVEQLLPLAGLITPNRPEAEILAGRQLRSPQDARAAAVDMARRFQATVVLKGGHDEGDNVADIVTDGSRSWVMTAARIAAPTTHGTGCSLSAAAAACLARGDELQAALRQAKAYVCNALASCCRVGPDAWAMMPRADSGPAEVTCREL